MQRLIQPETAGGHKGEVSVALLRFVEAVVAFRRNAAAVGDI